MFFPRTKPAETPAALWQLQVELLANAEGTFGLRDRSKEVCQPQFTDQGPMLRNTAQQDGAYAELSHAAGNHWPTAVFELAHETVHLLNPTVGCTNYFEEGIAVHFSLLMAPEFNEYFRNSHSPYCEALNLVEEVSCAPLETGREARERFGALSAISEAQLAEICPDAREGLLAKLASDFEITPRTNQTNSIAI